MQTCEPSEIPTRGQPSHIPLVQHVGGDHHTTLSSTVPWDLAESQRIAGKFWPKVGGFFANQASSELHTHVNETH